jgi:hypothetical protein
MNRAESRYRRIGIYRKGKILDLVTSVKNSGQRIDRIKPRLSDDGLMMGHASYSHRDSHLPGGCSLGKSWEASH